MTRKLSIAIMLTFGFGSPVLSDTVSSAQRILNELGYNAGTVDGSYGNRTKRALESFYVDNNSLYDGKLDDNEIADLKLAAEKAHGASKLILDTIVREPFKASKCRDVFEGNVRLHSKSHSKHYHQKILKQVYPAVEEHPPFLLLDNKT